MMKKNSWLIQRLEKVNPGRIQKGKLSHMFTFGCGSSGLSDEAADMVAEAWNFDYMGNARFEKGNVAKSLCNIQNYYNDGIIVNGETSVTPRLKIIEGTSTNPQAVPVYYICKGEDEEYLKGLVKDLAIPLKIKLEEYSLFDFATRELSFEKRYMPLLEKESTPSESKKEIEKYVKEHEYVKRFGGWLELDNHFLFFVDKDMYERAQKIFSVE